MRSYCLFLLALSSGPALAGAKPTIGLVVNRVSKSTFQHLGLKAAVRVVSVWPDCSADGLMVKGDMLAEIDGEPIDSPLTLTNLVQRFTPGDQLGVIFYHDEERQEAQLVVGRRAIKGCERVTATNPPTAPVAAPAPTPAPATATATAESDTDLVTQLERLKKLYTDGVLTEAEFEAAKARALDVERKP